MKKFRVISIILLAALFTVMPAYADDAVSVTIDGQPVIFADQAPVIVDGRTLIPVRGVFEQIGFEVEWHYDARQAELTRDDNVIVITIDSSIFTVNGVNHILDVPAQIIGGRTMLPIRAVLESVNYEVDWDAATRTVLISSMYVYAGIEQITIPNRRLTDAEIAEWIEIYNSSGGANGFELEVIRLVNIERAREGIASLQADPVLMMAARFKSQSMYDLDYFSHTSPVYGSFVNISREVFGFSARAMAENLALGQRTPEAVIQSWMNSAGHRRNLMNPSYTIIGVGFHENRWTQKFSN